MRRRLNYYHFYLRVVAYLLPFLAFEGAAYARLLWRRWQPSPAADSFSYVNLLLLTTVVWVMMAEHYEVTSVEELFRERTGIRAAFAACSATYALVIGILFFLRHAAFYVLLPTTAIFLLLLTLIMRATFRNVVNRHVELRKPNRILIIGADQFAQTAARRLVSGPLSSCRVMGFVSLPGQEITADAAPVFPLERIKEICSNEVDDILIAVPPSRFSEIPQIVSAVDRFYLPVRAVLDLGQNISIQNRLFQLGHLQMFDLTATPTESIEYSLLKRTFDIAFSILILLLMAPIMVLIAIAIRLDSRGPILFVQDRVGLNGKLFPMYKFRTMKVATSSVSDSRWTTPNDSRCTRIGRYLRKTSLDELPQFLNVLRGNMSVVGPRPERPRFVHKFLTEVAEYNNRHRLKVGITGWAQVNGWRGDTSIKKRVECDLYYLQNWSFAFDLQIIFQTLFAGIRGKNAY